MTRKYSLLLSISIFVLGTHAIASPIWQDYFDSAQKFLAANNLAAAAAAFQGSLTEAQKEPDPTPELAKSLYAYGAITFAQGTLDVAEFNLRKCISVNDQLCGENSEPSAYAHELLGEILLLQHNNINAETELKLANDYIKPIDGITEFRWRAHEKLYLAEAALSRPGADSLRLPGTFSYSLSSDINAYLKTLDNSVLDKTKYAAAVDYSVYLIDSQATILKKWSSIPAKKSGRTVILFTADKSGKIANARIGTSSGEKTVDQNALNAVRNSTLSRLPEGAPNTIKLKFDFCARGGKGISREL